MADIHPAFRWCRTSGFQADEAVETPQGDLVRVQQWVWTPEGGWDRLVITYDPAATAAAMARAYA